MLISFHLFFFLFFLFTFFSFPVSFSHLINSYDITKDFQALVLEIF